MLLMPYVVDAEVEPAARPSPNAMLDQLANGNASALVSCPVTALTTALADLGVEDTPLMAREA